MTWKFSSTAGWIRVGRYVLEYKHRSRRPLYSERAGYVRYRPLPFGFRGRVFKNNN